MDLEDIKKEIKDIVAQVMSEKPNLSLEEVVKSVCDIYVENRKVEGLEKGTKGIFGEKRVWGGNVWKKDTDGSWKKGKKAGTTETPKKDSAPDKKGKGDVAGKVVKDKKDDKKEKKEAPDWVKHYIKHKDPDRIEIKLSKKGKKDEQGKK